MLPTPETIADKLSHGARLAFDMEPAPQPESSLWRYYLEGNDSFTSLADSVFRHLIDGQH